MNQATYDGGVLIEDGYNLEKTLPARGKRKPLTFTYRPALPKEVYRFTKAQAADGDEVFKKVSGLLLKHLVSWDVTQKKGEEYVTAPITAQTLEKMPHDILEQMVLCVTGYAIEEAETDLKN